MRNTRWIYKTKEITENRFGLDYEIEKVLLNRGIENKNEVSKYLNGTIEDLISPTKLKDVEKSGARILEARDKNEEVWIYGDYDVDGITSTSICYLALKEIGVNVKYYIPLRDEGYGLNKEAISHIKEKGGDLIITVDCGISSIEEVKHCNQLGIDMIITDHHEITSGLPEAYGIVNPKRTDNETDFKYFAGVGTAFMLLLHVYDALDRKENMYKFLDIVAIGTVADIVPLKEDNRIIVREGLKLLKSSKWLGLNMLIKRLYEEPKEKKFDPYDIGFIIAPVFNAAGRLEDAKKAVQLLISDDHVECDRLVYELIQQNNERKDVQENILQRALEKIEAEELDKNNVVVVAEEGFHHGVIGIVASKILDRYYKPTIIMEIKPSEGIATASCRSIENFSMIDALSSMRELFVKFGGHAGAAGFSIPIENIDEFSKRINKFAGDILTDEDKEKPIKIDSNISMLKVSYDLMNKLSKLEPYGFGNASPMFSLKNCGYKNFRQIGKDKNHLMFDVVKDGVEMKNCVWFNAEDMVSSILENPKIDIAFKLKMETYKDKYQYKMFVEDIKIAGDRIETLEEDVILKNVNFPIKSVFYTRREVTGTKLELAFVNDDILVVNGQSTVGFLDNQTKNFLKKLKENYGYNFKINVTNIEKKEENFNVFIEIDLDFEFSSLALKEGKLFGEIKNFLIGELDYNSVQKKVLKTIFKDKKRVEINLQRGRGIRTLLKTIDLYYKSFGKMVLIVTDKKDEYFLNKNFHISENFESGYDYYIGIEKENDDRFNFYINSKNVGEGVEKLSDDYKLLKNIVIVKKNELKNYENIFYKEMSKKEKKNVIDKIKQENKTYYSTDDIKIIL